MSAENGRLVYLSDDLCGCIYNALAQAYSGTPEKADDFHARWKAAPANPAEAVRHQLVHRYGLKRLVSSTMIADVLAALGAPQRPTPRDEASS